MILFQVRENPADSAEKASENGVDDLLRRMHPWMTPSKTLRNTSAKTGTIIGRKTNTPLTSHRPLVTLSRNIMAKFQTPEYPIVSIETREETIGSDVY